MSAASGHRPRPPEPGPTRPESPSGPAPIGGSSGLNHLDIEQRLALLKKQFSEQNETDVPPDASAAPKPQTSGSKVLLRRGIKTLLAIAVVAAVVWLPTQRLFQTTSVEAVVNARTLTLRAPIEGVVSFDSATPAAVGAAFNAGAPLLHVTNSRADRARLDDLRRLAERAETDVALLKDRLDNATRMQTQYAEQTQLFRRGRIAQLEARLQESQNNLSSATTRQEETAAILERATALDAQGFQPKAQLDKARRDNTIAKFDALSIEQRIKGILVELEAARSGTFLGDSYNDRPTSAQRADDLRLQMSELSAQLKEKQATLEQLKQDVALEDARYQRNSAAPVIVPSSGTVWEVLTAQGEHVERGQDLVRMLDCNAAVVTAVVSESDYNRLSIGTQATFRFRDGDTAPMVGHVVSLTGVATAASNFAITPASLRKEQYRVTVDVPALNGQGCKLGRTGQVVFGSKVDAPVAATAQ